MQVLEQCREQLPVAFHKSIPVGEALAFLFYCKKQHSQPKGQPTNKSQPCRSFLPAWMQVLEQCREQLPVAFHNSIPVG